jgi:ADP-heptose:LPS heptosyltransferase
MDVDDVGHVMSPSKSHPLSQLHSQLISHLSDTLPHLAYDAALMEQERRKSVKSPPSQAGQKQSALYTSIHAPKGAEKVESMRAFVMPAQGDVQLWKPLDCIHFALEFPPMTEKVSRNRRPPSIAKLKLFLLAQDQPGGRRGRDWSAGDWKQSLEELDQVASFCGWQSIHACVEICRSQLSGSGFHI